MEKLGINFIGRRQFLKVIWIKILLEKRLKLSPTQTLHISASCNLQLNVSTSLHFSAKWTHVKTSVYLNHVVCLIKKKKKKNYPLNNSNGRYEEIDNVEERILFLQRQLKNKEYFDCWNLECSVFYCRRM